MIQRIQSLYIVLGIVALLLVFFFEAVWPDPPTQAPDWMPLGFALPVLVATGMALWALVSFRDRNRQHRIVLYAQVVTILSIMVLIYSFWSVGVLEGLFRGPGSTSRSFALLLPFAAYIMFFMARKAIERDIALVRSMDRLR